MAQLRQLVTITNKSHKHQAMHSPAISEDSGASLIATDALVDDLLSSYETLWSLGEDL